MVIEKMNARSGTNDDQPVDIKRFNGPCVHERFAFGGGVITLIIADEKKSSK